MPAQDTNAMTIARGHVTPPPAFPHFPGILALDRSMSPYAWYDARDAIHAYLTADVVNELGYEVLWFRGGISRATGRRSELLVASIIVVGSADIYRNWKRDYIPFSREGVLRRDRQTCAYCLSRGETVDHIIPLSHGGANTWMNCVAACGHCNWHRKRNRRPEEAGMQLRFLPYKPCRFEAAILSGRRILADQMEFLRAGLPPHSRMHA